MQRVKGNKGWRVSFPMIQALLQLKIGYAILLIEFSGSLFFGGCENVFKINSVHIQLLILGFVMGLLGNRRSYVERIKKLI